MCTDLTDISSCFGISSSHHGGRLEVAAETRSFTRRDSLFRSLSLSHSLFLWQEGNGKQDAHRTFAIILCHGLDCTLALENPFLSLFFFPQLFSNRCKNTRRLPSTFIAPKRLPRLAITRPGGASTLRT